jgi:hypothetical protein
MTTTIGAPDVMAAQNGNCVEVASAGAVLIRDTQNRDGATLSISPQVWRAFTARVRSS